MKPIPLSQGSPEWKLWRKGGIGGSDVAAILGLSPYTDPPHTRADVFAEKVHGIERDCNFAMHRGTRLEPAARLAYQDRHRTTAKPACVEHDEFPWARVSLDGLCNNGAVLGRLQWLLELKCPNWQTHDAALQGCVAEHFDIQCQWQMFVTGVQRLDFASFNPGERFTPEDWPLMAQWQIQVERWQARPRVDRGKRPECLDLWLDAPDARRPSMPAEWLAVLPVEPNRDKQAWIFEEAGKFWFEVEEAREAEAAKRPAARPDERFAAEAI